MGYRVFHQIRGDGEMKVTYRSVREWICPSCGSSNITSEVDIKEEGGAECCRCPCEVRDDEFEEEVEEC